MKGYVVILTRLLCSSRTHIPSPAFGYSYDVCMITCKHKSRRNPYYPVYFLWKLNGLSDSTCSCKEFSSLNLIHFTRTPLRSFWPYPNVSVSLHLFMKTSRPVTVPTAVLRRNWQPSYIMSSSSTIPKFSSTSESGLCIAKVQISEFIGYRWMIERVIMRL